MGCFYIYINSASDDLFFGFVHFLQLVEQGIFVLFDLFAVSFLVVVILFACIIMCLLASSF
jgi:hypothetical protein